MDNELSIEMYSFREWDTELRRKFYLPYDPYYLGDDPQKTAATEKSLEVLRTYGVFFYRDDRHPMGLIIQPTGTLPVEIQEGKGFDCDDQVNAFFFMGVTSHPVLRILEWAKPTDRSHLPKYEKQFEKWGDYNKWYRFNRPCIVRRVRPGAVSTFM